MTYSDLVQRLKIAIYQEAQSSTDFVHLDEAAKKYGFEYQEGLIAEAQQDLVATGFITGPRPIGGDTTALGKITGAGRREIEGKFGSKDGVGQILQPVDETKVHSLIAPNVSTGSPETTNPVLSVFQRVEPTASTTPTFLNGSRGIDNALPAGETMSDWSRSSPELAPSSNVDSAVSGHIATEASVTSHPPAVSSAQWTGTRHIVVDEQIIKEMRMKAGEIRRLIYEIHIPNNAQSDDLKSLAEVLVQLCEMCEPELTVIERVLASPKFKVSASVIAAVATLRGALGL